jgi:hypothetical protein
VRVASPGNGGAVTQTNSSSAGAATSTLGPKPDPQVTPDAVPVVASASTTQVVPSNINVSVRIDSPGDDGPVTQTNVALSGATTQYHSPDPQYHSTTASSSGDTGTVATTVPLVSTLDGAATPLPAPDSAPGPSVPDAALPTEGVRTSWTWVWTWTCGGTTSSASTMQIDTGISGWTWTWNLNGVCGLPPPTTSQLLSTISSPNVSAPLPPTIVAPRPPTIRAPVAPTLPTAPAVQQPVPPTPPTIWAPVAPTPPTAPEVQQPVQPMPPTIEAPLLPLDAPAGMLTVPAAAPKPSAFPAQLPAALLPVARATRVGAEAATSATDPSRTPAARREGSGGKPPAPAPPTLDGVSISGSAPGGGSSSGLPAALLLWLLLQLPGLVVLRLQSTAPPLRNRAGGRLERPG